MKNLEILDETMIYIACPANIATGGPELLHQFAYKLKRLNLNIFMYYMNKVEKNPVHENYKEYDIKWTEEIIDNSKNIVIVPEINTPLLHEFSKIQKIVWWLSIDFYFLTLKGFRGRLNRFLLDKLNTQKYYLGFDNKLNNINLNMVQSKYAEFVLHSKGIRNIVYMSDYLHDNFINIETDEALKENIVAYNPKKGIKFTKQLINAFSDIKFIPIENMSRKEVVELLQKAKVYIDFGFHPGKDRIPREAAILKCCVITNKKGSANFFEDLPIKDEYKFIDIESSIDKIGNQINSCFNEYNKKIKDFEEYICEIMEQEKKFNLEIDELIK